MILFLLRARNGETIVPHLSFLPFCEWADKILSCIFYKWKNNIRYVTGRVWWRKQKKPRERRMEKGCIKTSPTFWPCWEMILCVNSQLCRNNEKVSRKHFWIQPRLAPFIFQDWFKVPLNHFWGGVDLTSFQTSKMCFPNTPVTCDLIPFNYRMIESFLSQWLSIFRKMDLFSSLHKDYKSLVWINVTSC